ncbi:imidazole glycerol phosphate synthase subunit HisH [Cryobacterium sp. Sr3]|uniref:imidazole glycerol phosphate synthase subunit HisH n=1 Tax=Cryobacterium sp. Sr3 TaxID=1259194 RepID=UPI00106A53DE|nr:imidazole glycerol phosphate synthase subunit HisH [Cryobacterium sp. Sr3]TFB55265.1 imidazole glycerol phosphate synthase subunit HisH [Cryobacterium sp. Sr3]
MSVGILNYGVGNVGSLVNMFRKLDIETQLVSTADDIRRVSRLVLPGVGSFDHAMRALEHKELIEPLREYADSGNFLLGICLGMQLLMDSSEEGVLCGLGYIGGVARRFQADGATQVLRVPHMGWNSISPAKDSLVFANLREKNRFYFAHSYYVECAQEPDVLATTDYEITFASMVARENVMGAQFHPEKSHVYGMTLLENWGQK